MSEEMESLLHMTRCVDEDDLQVESQLFLLSILRLELVPGKLGELHNRHRC